MGIYSVQINLVLSLLLLILMVHAHFKMNKKIETNRMFIWLMSGILIILILEALSVVLNTPYHVTWIAFHKVVNVLGFALSPLIPFVGYLFIIKWINRFSRVKIAIQKVLLIPIVVNGVLALLNYKGAFLFYITENNIYERGPYFFVLPTVCYMLFAYNLYIIFKHRKGLTFSECVVLSLFYIGPSISALIQIKYASILTAWNSAALIVVMTYIFILNDQSYRDNLTGLENRMAYEHYAQSLEDKNHFQMCMIFLDIDNLKDTNDRHGHHAGDELLKKFSNLLRDSFPRSRKLIRLGGDEFLVILEEKNQQIVEEKVERLLQKTTKENEDMTNEVPISYSYGLVSRQSGESLQQLLKRADQLMYAQKTMRKEKGLC